MAYSDVSLLPKKVEYLNTGRFILVEEENFFIPLSGPGKHEVKIMLPLDKIPINDVLKIIKDTKLMSVSRRP